MILVCQWIFACCVHGWILSIQVFLIVGAGYAILPRTAVDLSYTGDPVQALPKQDSLSAAREAQLDIRIRTRWSVTERKGLVKAVEHCNLYADSVCRVANTRTRLSNDHIYRQCTCRVVFDVCELQLYARSTIRQRSL